MNAKAEVLPKEFGTNKIFINANTINKLFLKRSNMILEEFNKSKRKNKISKMGFKFRDGKPIIYCIGTDRGMSEFLNTNFSCLKNILSKCIEDLENGKRLREVDSKSIIFVETKKYYYDRRKYEEDQIMAKLHRLWLTGEYK